jgi:hypothetical protein
MIRSTAAAAAAFLVLAAMGPLALLAVPALADSQAALIAR